MRKRTGSVREEVERLLRERGLDTGTLQVARMGGTGCIYMIAIEEQVIGEYNILAKQLWLYDLPEE